jgi:hypothetical protein
VPTQRVTDRVPLSGSHSRTVPSQEPEASSGRPSAPAPNATAFTPPVWPRSGSPIGVPVVGSQSRTVSS